MSSRFVAIDEGPDIALDRAMVVVGRHPNCDTRLDSLQVSRHHCCMSREDDQVMVRDLGSTNGIRINGMRVETGRLQPGDELSIAHIRYRLEGEEDSEQGSDPAVREQDSARDSSPTFGVVFGTAGVDQPAFSLQRRLINDVISKYPPRRVSLL
jgi:pSer/pThr/pTyr-binding forkhead associated (FHA) protein